MLAIADIKTAVSKIAPNYPIKQVHLFGSYADGNASPKSDVDVMVEFAERPVTLLDYCGFQEELSELLNVNIDIIKAPLSDVAKKELFIGKVVCIYG